MEKEKKQIELRSEKVRNIIGQVPSVLLRYGISIIGLSLLMLIIIASFIPYQPTIETEISAIQSETGLIYYSARIPQDALRNKLQFTYITIESDTDLPLPSQFRIITISDTVNISGNDAWYTAVLSPVNTPLQTVKLENPLSISAKIILKKQSVLKWIIEKF